MKRSVPSMPALAGIVLATLLAACGAGTDPAANEAGRARPMADTPVIAPLLDDEGRPMATDPAAVPADPLARTRSALYATPAQAAQLEETLGRGVIRVVVEPGADATAAVQAAAATAGHVRAAQGLPDDAPVLVHGRDPRLAALAVQALETMGFDRVFLVGAASR